MINTLYRDHGKNPHHHPLLAIDVENNPDTGQFICAGLYGYRKDHHGKQHLINKYFDDREELKKFLLSFPPEKKNIPFYLIGFNFGYDHPFIHDIIKPESLFYAGSNFITARLTNNVKMIDLCNHVDGSLEDWIGHLKMYESHAIKKETLDDLKVRVMSDVQATYILGVFIQDFYVDMGVSFKFTIGSAALSLFTRKFFKYMFRREDKYNNYERAAYRGGRVEIFEKGIHEVKSYDVNSMYLSIMTNELIPDPNTIKVYIDNNRDWKENFKNYEGVFHVKVKVGKQKVMCLPYVHNGKLIFPYGEFSGYWTSIELKEALKNGYKITECYSYVIYRKMLPLFKEFGEFIWNKRLEYKAAGNKGMDILVKKMGNTPYGKFAQRNKKGGYWGKLSDYKGNLEGVNINPTTVYNEEYVAISGDIMEDAKHTFPIISVWISSHARIKLYRMMKKHEYSIIYVDTDSIKIKSTDNEVSSKELGGWGYEYSKKQLFIKPKFYDDKCKGVPKRAELYCDLGDHQVKATYDKPNKFKESIRRGLIINKWESRTKIIDMNDDKRNWISEFQSEPIEINEQ